MHIRRRPGTIHALITGGAGFIGSHLAEALLQRGYQVTVFDNLTTGRLQNVTHLTIYPGFRCIIGNIANRRSVERLVKSADVVFHLAAAVGVDLILKDPVGSIETNILGSHLLLQAAAQYGKRTLIASTSEVYGKGTRIPFSEEDDRLLGSTTKSRWSYAEAKAVDEFLGLAYHQQVGLPITIFRLFNTVGQRQSGRYGMVIPRFVRQALEGGRLTVYGDGGQSRCFCDVEDAVRAIIGLAEYPGAVGQVYNIGSTNETTILDLARRVLALTGEHRHQPVGLGSPIEAPTTSGPSPRPDDDRIVFIPYSQAYEAGFEDMQRRVPDTSKIRAAIGWEPKVSLDTTLRRVIASTMEEISATQMTTGVAA